MSGEDAKPVVRIVEPQDGAVLKEVIVPLKAEVTDDGGAPRVEVRIDGGLWREAPCDGVLQAKCLLQSGEHTIAVRATDSGRNQTEHAIHVRVEVEAPAARILDPAEGARTDARTTLVRVECPAETILAAVRVAGGPWRRAKVEGGVAEVAVPLEFGHQALEAMVVGPRGVAGHATCALECSRQPEAATAPEMQASAAEGLVEIEGLGQVDMFKGQDAVVVEGALQRR